MITPMDPATFLDFAKRDILESPNDFHVIESGTKGYVPPAGRLKLIWIPDGKTWQDFLDWCDTREQEVERRRKEWERTHEPQSDAEVNGA